MILFIIKVISRSYLVFPNPTSLTFSFSSISISVFLTPVDVRVWPWKLPGPYDWNQQWVYERVWDGHGQSALPSCWMWPVSNKQLHAVISDMTITVMVRSSSQVTHPDAYSFPHLLLPPSLFLPFSLVLLVLSRWTSVVRCISWRKASILAGTAGATARGMTICSHSGLSAWY